VSVLECVHNVYNCECIIEIVTGEKNWIYDMCLENSVCDERDIGNADKFHKSSRIGGR